MKLHLDEDADAHALLNALRHRGLDVSSSRELALLQCSDEEQLARASEQGRAIYTYNASDFCRLHSEFLQHGCHHAGIIIGDQQVLSIGEVTRRLLRINEARSVADMCDQLEFLSNWSGAADL
jgi:diadenosine tetraphosphatase ApaH/serine/threonine PP2A family protein phosphatase